ncbi:MAG: hypothetical protein R8G66_11190 [Cytophagales bacterium]|nr:hypothetical protein [Cytophagales bacterium]
MHHFNYKNRSLTSGPHLIGALFILAGLFALASPYIFNMVVSTERVMAVGIGATLFGLLIVTSYSGVLIDYSQKRYKEYTSVAGYKFGEWEVLPTVSEVQVLSISYIHTNSPNGVSPTLSGRVTDYKTLLYADDGQPLLSLDYTNKNQAVKQAEDLASSLNAELVFKLS